MNKPLKDTIFELECELQKPETRKSVEKLDKIISDNLYEITSSGKITHKQDCLINLPNAPEIKFVMTNFEMRQLAPDLVQTFFETEKTVVTTGEISHSLRSSIWQNEAGTWKMIFHQGTPK